MSDSGQLNNNAVMSSADKREPMTKILNTVSEESTSELSQDGEAAVVVPPDGGWGWFVVFASFCCNMIVDGIIFSFGMFLTDIMKSFSTTKSEVALVGSLLSGFYLMAGPFVSALANKYGFQLVTIIGSVIGSAAFVLSSFSTNVEFLCISYGILGGIGFGMIYVPAVITVGFYFEKWRALATGIAVCGSGIGTFVLAPISTTLIERFGWRQALLIQAALVLSCGAFGAVFRPIKPVKVTSKSRKTPETIDNQKETHFPFGSLSSLNSKTVPVKVNYNYPTAKDVYAEKSNFHANMLLSKSEKKLAQDFLGKKEDVFEPLIEERKLERRHTMGEKLAKQPEEEVYRKTTQPEDVSRPFYRDDIFFGASLQRLPQYTSHTSLGYHLSVTRLPTKQEIEEEKTAKCKLCPQSVKRIISTMLDFSLLKSPSFLLLAFSGFFTMMGFYVPYMYLTDRAVTAGMELSSAMWLVSGIGIANTVGRVLCGVLTSFPGCDALLINNIAITIAGIATFFSGVSDSNEYQFFYAGIFGLSISCFASLRSILVVDLMGLEKLTNAFGLLLLFQGVAATIGAPIAGAFMDMTGSYDASFYLSGGLITLSAAMCYPIGRINRWEKRRRAEAASSNSV